MPKFKFPLEAVLKHRTHAEQERMRELAVCQGEMTRLQNELKALNDSMQASAADMKSNHLVGTIDVAYLAAHRRFTVAMQRKGQVLVQDMARQQRKVDDAQRLLAEAAKERKVIEKLRERQFDRWKQEVERKELAEMDEVGAQFGYRQLAAAQAEMEQEMVGSAADTGESLAASRTGAARTAKPQATSGPVRRNEFDGASEEQS
jgi:flagellar FliJ protein